MDTVDAGGALGWCFILCLGLGLLVERIASKRCGE